MSKISEMTRESWIESTFPEWGTWLVEDIENEVVAPENVAMWWLGCTGVWFKTPADTNITIDLWCGNGKRTHGDGKMKVGHQMANMCGGRAMQPNLRNVPFVIDPFAFKKVDAVLATHYHQDHMSAEWAAHVINSGMTTTDENGNPAFTWGTIMLPEGKIPFVLSEDDVSYYHYMDGDGFATKLVIDDNGDIKCEYKKADGTVVTGDYDVVPILDSFIKEHPDFSYHGRKGILAMTGYNGVLGYRTDGAYKTKKNLQDDQKAFLKANPDFDYDKEVKAAKKVAKAMKKDGWEFASHTWGHRNATSSTAAELKTDNKKWEKYVAPILGKTDMIIFAFGADIGDWEGYTSDNEKYEYYKSRGYRYFCNVDSSQYFVQITSEYFRQGRRNLDGYRMYYNPDMLSDLFDVSEVWDSSRPTPVPEM